MDDNTTKIITELQIMLRNTQEDLRALKNQDMKELRSDMKELKKCLPTLEAHSNLVKRVEKIEANHSKIVWFILLGVLGAILSLVIGQ